ncbi:MAG: TolC family protein [Desulfobulbaceae bacterium]
MRDKKSFYMPVGRLTGLLIALLLFTGMAADAAADPGQPVIPDVWTPENAVSFALENNPDTGIAARRMEAARASIREARSSFLPSLDLALSYQRTDTPMYSFGNILNQGEFDNSIDFNDPGPSDNLQMNATIRYRVYNGGRDRAGIAAAEAAEAATQSDMEAVRSRLAFSVVQALYTIVQADDTLQSRKAALEAITASVQVARARHEAGDLLKADLLNLEVLLSEARENLIQARHGADLARRAFLTLLGLEEGPVTIAADCATDQLVPDTLTFDKRPELKRLEAAIQEAEARLLQARGGFLPTADLFAGYQVDKGFEFDGSGDSYLAGVKLNFNLYEGRRTEARVAAARARLAELLEQKRKLQLAIRLEVERAKLALDEARQRLLVTDKMVEQAKESAALSRERFLEGLILSSELIDVENRLISAQVRRTMARAAARIAVADLRRAVGLSQFPDSGPVSRDNSVTHSSSQEKP